MDSQTRRTILATVLCFLILFGWIKIQGVLNPPKTPDQTASAPAGFPATTTAPANATGPSTTQDTVISAAQTDGDTSGISGGGDASNVTGDQPSGFSVPDAPATETVTLGDDRENNEETGFANPYEFSVVVTPRGAGVESMKLSRYRNAIPKDKELSGDDPYDLLRLLKDPTSEKTFASFVTHYLKITEGNKSPVVNLGDAAWSIEKTTDDKGETATLQTTVNRDEAPVVKIRKTYRLDKGSSNLQIGLQVENASDKTLKLTLLQRGGVGMKKEDIRMEYRRVVAAVLDENDIITTGGDNTAKRDEVFKKGGERHQKSLKVGDERLLWSAVGNKYFTCLMAPLPQPTDENRSAYPAVLNNVYGRTLFETKGAMDDLTMEQEYVPENALAPGEVWTIAIDTYCGPKSKGLFDASPVATSREYALVSNPDHSGCTFEWLSRIMLWLLTQSHSLVHNFGVAIIILVIIVRLILHPVTKMGQINMMKMQKGMAQLKPKLEVIQQQYKNDKQKIQEETMKLYREEGINPAGQIFGCLPMFLQMPVWIALWTTLNTNVDMRHEPFFFWITDLSSPDALFSFNHAFEIPLLGAMMGPISSFNLLPIIMSITMYMQQKLTQKLTKPTTPVAPKTDKHGKVIPDQMAQQQKITSFMMIFFGFLFYNFPSGLNLYILSSNLLGMLEQHRIRKHIRDKDESGGVAVKKKSDDGKSSGPSFMEKLAKKAEEAKRETSGRAAAGEKRNRKKSRF